MRVARPRPQGFGTAIAAYGPRVKWVFLDKLGNVLNEWDIVSCLNTAAAKAWNSVSDDAKGTLGVWFCTIALNAAEDMARGAECEPGVRRRITTRTMNKLKWQVFETQLQRAREAAEEIAARMRLLAPVEPLRVADDEHHMLRVNAGNFRERFDGQLEFHPAKRRFILYYNTKYYIDTFLKGSIIHARDSLSPRNLGTISLNATERTCLEAASHIRQAASVLWKS